MKKKILFPLLAVILVLGGTGGAFVYQSSSRAEGPSCQTQESQDLASAFSVKDEIFLLDVREPEEFAASSFRGAVNIPLSEVEQRLSEIPSDRQIFVICRSGRRSTAASEILLRHGFRNVTNVEGGMNKWYAEISHKKGC